MTEQIEPKPTCGTCDGFGLIRIMNSDATFRWRDCPTCHGTGERNDR